MKNVPLLLGTILGSIALIFVIGFLFSRTPQTSTTSVDRAILENDLVNTRGASASATASSSAKVTVVEFSDFQCPACRAVEPLIAQLNQEYADRVTFGFRHFPLESIHQNARAAAIAAEAAARQNAFWPYHDILFEKQDEWSEVTDPSQLQNLFIEFATTLTLDENTFRSDLNNSDTAAQITSDTALATQLKVNSTPSFFVNGIPTASTKLRESIESALLVP